MNSAAAAADGVPDGGDDQPRPIDEHPGSALLAARGVAEHDRGHRSLMPQEPLDAAFPHYRDPAHDHRDGDRVAEGEEGQAERPQPASSIEQLTPLCRGFVYIKRISGGGGRCWPLPGPASLTRRLRPSPLRSGAAAAARPDRPPVPRTAPGSAP